MEWGTVAGAVGIQSRRYLGNKYGIVEPIRELIIAACGSISTFVDAFAGSGVVAMGFNSGNVKVIANDILYSNYICLSAFLETVDEAHVDSASDIIDQLNRLDTEDPRCKDDYFNTHFGGTYFTEENARRIGAIRNEIARMDCPEQVRRLLLASLLYAVDKVANTCGHYDAYRKTLDTTQRLILKVPLLQPELNAGNQVFCQDANKLCHGLECDVLFLDPPYNSRQYCDSYHLLENLARWEKPPVTGKAAKMDRRTIKSRYCLKDAPAALSELVSNSEARWIVLTYNSMGNQGDPRSNARITDDELWAILGKYGDVSVHELDHPLFNAGRSNHQGNKERVFICRRRGR